MGRCSSKQRHKSEGSLGSCSHSRCETPWVQCLGSELPRAAPRQALRRLWGGKGEVPHHCIRVLCFALQTARLTLTLISYQTITGHLCNVCCALMHNASIPSSCTNRSCDAQPQNGLNPALPPCLMLLTDLMPPNTAVSTVLQESSSSWVFPAFFHIAVPTAALRQSHTCHKLSKLGLAPNWQPTMKDATHQEAFRQQQYCL